VPSGKDSRKTSKGDMRIHNATFSRLRRQLTKVGGNYFPLVEPNGGHFQYQAGRKDRDIGVVSDDTSLQRFLVEGRMIGAKRNTSWCGWRESQIHVVTSSLEARSEWKDASTTASTK